jgi:hypothetical protein
MLSLEAGEPQTLIWSTMKPTRLNRPVAKVTHGEPSMKAIVASLAVLALTAGLARLATETYRKKRLRAAYAGKPYARVYGYRSPDDSIGGYYEHRLDAVRFGSQRWWKIYDEQHGGSNRP